MDFKKLHGRPKTYTIGKHLPPEEQVAIELWPLSIEDLHLAEMSPIEENDPQYDEKIKRRLEKMKTMLAKMLKTTEEDVGQFSAEFFEEILECAMKRMGIEDEKMERVKAMLKKRAGDVGG